LREEIFITREVIFPNRAVLSAFPSDAGASSLCAVRVMEEGPVQPAVGDPASAGGLDWVTHRGPFQPLLFCDLGLNDQFPSQSNAASQMERKRSRVAWRTRRKRRGGSAWLFLAWWEDLQVP